MLSKSAADRFLRRSGAFGVFAAKVSVAGGAAWMVLGEFDRGAQSIGLGLILWPFAAWARAAGGEP